MRRLRTQPTLRAIAGFNRVELAAVLAVLAVVVVVVAGCGAKARDNSQRAACLGNMGQVGGALLRYVADNQGTMPPGTRRVFNYGSPIAPPNVLTLLSPYVTNRVFACPGLEPAADPDFAPTESSDTSDLFNGLVLQAGLGPIPKPGAVIMIQENWARMNYMLIQPERASKGMYTQWHTWTDTTDTSEGWSGTAREHFSNAHEDGGNLIFADGHGEYRKYRNLESSDFGLVDPDSGRSDPYQPTEEHSRKKYKPMF